MNIIAPVFAPENAEFASANQDLILRAMQRITPNCNQPQTFYGDVSKLVVPAMAGGKEMTLKQIADGAGITYSQAKSWIQKQVIHGRVVQTRKTEGRKVAAMFKAVQS